eukprot:2292733-Amphidinium_carterae.1
MSKGWGTFELLVVRNVRIAGARGIEHQAAQVPEVVYVSEEICNLVGHAADRRVRFLSIASDPISPYVLK